MDKLQKKIQLGAKIKQARLQNQLTQQDLADKLGFTKGLISQWEKGLSEPMALTLIELQKLLKCKF